MGLTINSYGQYQFDKSIIYTKTYKVEKQETSFSVFSRPDTIYYVVLFNSHSSLAFSRIKNNLINQESLTDLSDFKVINIDSSFIIQKKVSCKKQNILLFPTYNLLYIQKDTTVGKINCSIAYSINKVGDTSIFYLSMNLPKAAGALIIGNIPECVVGFESKTMTVLPKSSIISYEEPFYFNIDFQKVDRNLISQDTWIEGKFTELEESKLFPEFIAKDINKIRITNNSLKQNENSIFIIVNSLMGCESSNEKFSKFLLNQKEQNIDLLNAVSNLVKEKIASCYVLTDDYFENLNNLSYPQLHIIPNAVSWKEKMQIFQTPLILIIRNNIVKYKLTPFDFGEDEFYEGLKKRLVSK